MKKTLSVIFTLLLALSLCVGTFAFTTENGNSYVTDDADLLTAEQEEALLEKIEYIHNTYNFDVVFHTTMSTDGQYIADYADDYYDYNGYGYGNTYDGLLFMLNMNHNEEGNREYFTSTCGNGLYLFTDYAFADDGGFINFQILPYLRAGDYWGAFNTYIYYVEEFLIQAQSGAPYDYDNPHPEDSYAQTQPDEWYYPDDGFDYSDGYNNNYYDDYDYYIPSGPGNKNFWIHNTSRVVMYESIALIAAFIVAFLIMLAVKSSMNSARIKKEAASYIVPNSFNVTQSYTRFTRSHVTTVKKAQNTNHGGRPGGGVSGGGVRVGSSGRSHGGGGGRF